MAQLHLYLPHNLEDIIKQKAKAKGMSVSKYLAEIVRRELDNDWPEGFFDDVVGGWKGEPLLRSEQGDFELRENI